MVAIKRRSFMNQASRFAKRARPWLSTGLRVIRAFRGSGSRNAPRSSRSRDYGNLTFQNDEHQIYRRKRAPRRVRARHRRAAKNFAYNLDRLQGMRTVSITRTVNQAITPSSGSVAQGAFGVTLYGYGTNSATPGTNSNWANGDISYIFTAENGGAPNANLASSQLRFRSARMNLSIKNVTGTGEGTFGSLVIVDLYHCLIRKDCDAQSGTTTGDLSVLWNDAINLEGSIPNTTLVTSFQVDGVTPFDCPAFGEKCIVKRIRRVRLSDGQVFNTQMRDPGNYNLKESDLINGVNYKGNLTEGYLVVFYNAMADPTTGIRGIASLDVNYQKAYHYTYTTNNNDVIGRSNLI